MVREIMARLRIRVVAKACSFLSLWGASSNLLGESLLFGKGALDLVAQQIGEEKAQRFAFPREQVARARQVDGHDGLDAAGPCCEDDDAIGERHRLVDMVRDEEHGGAALAPDVDE